MLTSSPRACCCRAGLERGEGYFVATASAAGLLTQIGSAPYAVSKHAAVGFAEWLAITYGHRGIRVSCICPMGVRTPMLEVAEQGALEELAARVVRDMGTVLEPADVAAAAVEAIERERFWYCRIPRCSAQGR